MDAMFKQFSLEWFKDYLEKTAFYTGFQMVRLLMLCGSI